MRLRRYLIVSILAGSLVVGSAGAAFADMPSPGPFGKHISAMAPEHPQDHGAEFGACVSTMARGGNCNHVHPTG